MKRPLLTLFALLASTIAVQAQCWTCIAVDQCNCCYAEGNRASCQEIDQCTGCISLGDCSQGRFSQHREKYRIDFDELNLRQIAQQHPRIGFILAAIHHRYGYISADWVYTGLPMELKPEDIDIALRLPTVSAEYYRGYADRAARAAKTPNAISVQLAMVSKLTQLRSGTSILTLKVRYLNKSSNEPTFKSFVINLEGGPVWKIKDWKFDGLMTPVVSARATIKRGSSFR